MGHDFRQITGWKFDDLAITIQLRLCEALNSSRRTKEAGECLLGMASQEANLTGPILVWICGESLLTCHCYRTSENPPDLMQRCLSTRENATVAARGKNAPMAQKPSYLQPTLLLTEWAKLRLRYGSWKDALAASIGVSFPFASLACCCSDGSQFVFPKFVICRAICERLESNDRIADAVTCFLQMNTKAGKKVEAEQQNWIVGELSYCNICAIYMTNLR